MYQLSSHEKCFYLWLKLYLLQVRVKLIPTIFLTPHILYLSEGKCMLFNYAFHLWILLIIMVYYLSIYRIYLWSLWLIFFVIVIKNSWQQCFVVDILTENIVIKRNHWDFRRFASKRLACNWRDVWKARCSLFLHREHRQLYLFKQKLAVNTLIAIERASSFMFFKAPSRAEASVIAAVLFFNSRRK